jgi:hypothetical protein
MDGQWLTYRELTVSVGRSKVNGGDSRGTTA